MDIGYCGCSTRDDVQFDLYHIAEEIRIIGTAKADAVILAIDRRSSGYAEGGFPRLFIASNAVNGEREGDLFSHTAHRERAVSDKVLTLFLDATALECDLGILFDIEKICRAQVRIAALDSISTLVALITASRRLETSLAS